MDAGKLEAIPLPFEKIMSMLEYRVMEDIIRSIQINEFSTATADWQMERLLRLGRSEEKIKEYIQAALEMTDEEMEKVYSDAVYKQYYSYSRAYELKGITQVPLENNIELMTLMEAMKAQTKNTFRNITNSLGFAVRNPLTGKIEFNPVMQFYRSTLDDALMDISSGVMGYNKVLSRAINAMTASGLRWVDYESGHHNRVNVAARRAVMTGFRQVNGKINEQVARDLETDSYEVSWHMGARPSHQVWQGKVYTYQELQIICGLGTVEGLNGANCYHDYTAFIPGVSVRTYTDEQLEQMNAEENKPKNFNGKDYTTYEALQEQRRRETAMRKSRQDIHLLEVGGADKDTITLKKARYQVQQQQYKSFSKAMKLPEQMERVYQDGLGAIKKLRNVASEKSLRTKGGGTYGVNWKIVKSKEYTNRFLSISNNETANLLAAQRARNALVNRSGKKSEEIYAIGLVGGKDISSILNQNYDFGVIRTEKFAADIKRAEEKGERILFIHNHPNGTPPSIADINELLKHKNAFGITVGHTGSLYYYSKPSKKINEDDYKIALRKMMHYNGDTKMEKAMEYLAEKFEFEFKIL